jgi:hypothetical protein
MGEWKRNAALTHKSWVAARNGAPEVFHVGKATP